MESITWRPGIGDPSLMGWLTVLAYFIACLLCLRAYKSEKSGPARPLRETIPALIRVLRKHGKTPPAPAKRALTWLILAAVCLVLGINKQLDLQSLFTDVARAIARAGDWYEDRRIFQLLFIALILLASIFSASSLYRFSKGTPIEQRVSLFGLLFLAAFVILRASSFHHIDRLIGLQLGAMKLNWLFELGGIAIIGLGAYQRLSSKKSPPPNRP